MARESLSNSVEFERKGYGVELFRDEVEESIKLTSSEIKSLAEEL